MKPWHQSLMSIPLGRKELLRLPAILPRLSTGTFAFAAAEVEAKVTEADADFGAGGAQLE